jgi:peptidoglycan/LPS O-acetylase OafA/YrhL
LKKAATPQREIELDFIRGIAILLVIDFHSTHGFLTKPLAMLGFHHLGWIGVDIFFVLSGFLVGGLLMKEWKVRRGIDTRRFLIRRGFKIWPQYYFFLAAVLITGHRSINSLWGNLLNIQNYTGGIAHTWSLAVEEHVYLLLVLCLAIAARQKARVQSLFLFFSAICVFETVLRYIVAAHGYDIFTRTHTHMDGIIYGVLLAMIYHFAPERFHLLSSLWPLWIACFIASLAILRITQIPTGHPPLVALECDASNLFSISLLLLLYRRPISGKHNRLYRLVAWIGLYSYGIYLWHVSVIGPIDLFASRHRSFPGWLIGIAIPATGIALGAITTRLIEFPALRLRDKFFPKRVDSAAGIPARIEAP